MRLMPDDESRAITTSQGNASASNINSYVIDGNGVQESKDAEILRERIARLYPSVVEGNGHPQARALHPPAPANSSKEVINTVGSFDNDIAYSMALAALSAQRAAGKIDRNAILHNKQHRVVHTKKSGNSLQRDHSDLNKHACNQQGSVFSYEDNYTSVDGERRGAYPSSKKLESPSKYNANEYNERRTRHQRTDSARSNR